MLETSCRELVAELLKSKFSDLPEGEQRFIQQQCSKQIAPHIIAKKILDKRAKKVLSDKASAAAASAPAQEPEDEAGTKKGLEGDKGP